MVLHCVPSLHVGGVNKSLLTTVRALHSNQIDQVVCSLIDDRTLAPEIEAMGVRVETLGHSGSQSGLRTLLRLRALIRRHRVTVVHSHLSIAHAYGGLAAKLCGIPNVTSYHSVDAGRVSAFDRPKSYVTSRYIAVSEAVRQSMIDYRALPHDRIAVVHHGIDTSTIDDVDQASLESLRSGLVANEQARVLLNVGRLVPEKNQQLLVPITQELVREGFDVVTLVAGDGMLHDSLQAFIDDAGMSDRIHLLGRRFDVAQLVCCADVVVIPSSSEGFSIFALEAMAARRPVVASAIPALKEVVGDGSGALVTPGDAHEFATTIGDLLDSPERARRLGEQGRARVEQKFSTEAHARRLGAVYDEAAHPRGNVPSASTS